MEKDEQLKMRAAKLKAALSKFSKGTPIDKLITTLPRIVAAGPHRVSKLAMSIYQGSALGYYATWGQAGCQEYNSGLSRDSQSTQPTKKLRRCDKICLCLGGGWLPHSVKTKKITTQETTRG